MKSFLWKGTSHQLSEVGCDEAVDETADTSRSVPYANASKSTGALEPGGAIDIWTSSRIGYLLQYFTVGIVSGGLPATQYGLFICYLNVPAYVASAAAVVAMLPWSLKVFFALLSDTTPIAGYRRRPYMCIGWTVSVASLVVLAATPLPPPYYCFQADGQYDQTEVCNASAAHSGAFTIIFMMLAAIGYIMADVAADALTVQYARREEFSYRGRTQSTAYLVREWGRVAAALLVGFGLNGPEYNGSFSSGISFNTVCAILALPAAAMIPVSLVLIDEPPPHTPYVAARAGVPLKPAERTEGASLLRDASGLPV